MSAIKTLTFTAHFGDPAYTDDLRGDMVRIWNAFAKDDVQFTIAEDNVTCVPNTFGSHDVVVTKIITCDDYQAADTISAYVTHAHAVAACILKRSFHIDVKGA